MVACVRPQTSSVFHGSLMAFRMLICVMVVSVSVVPAGVVKVYKLIPCAVQASIAALQASAALCHLARLKVGLNSAVPSPFFKLAKSELPLYRGLAAYTSNFAFRPRAMGLVMRPSSEAVLPIKAGRCETEESSKPAM